MDEAVRENSVVVVIPCKLQIVIIFTCTQACGAQSQDADYKLTVTFYTYSITYTDCCASRHPTPKTELSSPWSGECLPNNRIWIIPAFQCSCDQSNHRHVITTRRIDRHHHGRLSLSRFIMSTYWLVWSASLSNGVTLNILQLQLALSKQVEQQGRIFHSKQLHCRCNIFYEMLNN